MKKYQWRLEDQLSKIALAGSEVQKAQMKMWKLPLQDELDRLSEIRCEGCDGFGHEKEDCPTHITLKKHCEGFPQFNGLFELASN